MRRLRPVTHENHFSPVRPLNRTEVLIRLRNRTTKITFRMNNHRRCHHAVRIRQRTLLTVRSRVPTGIGWEVVGITPREVCRSSHADKVIHTTLWNRSLEAIRLPDNPARQIATVAAANHPETLCIGPATRDGIIHTRHHIFHRRNAPVTL